MTKSEELTHLVDYKTTLVNNLQAKLKAKDSEFGIDKMLNRDKNRED